MSAAGPTLTRRPRPSCRHSHLQECPLTVEDWRQIHAACMAFRFQCALIAQRAHDREGQA